jgi:hypothetical protein
MHLCQCQFVTPNHQVHGTLELKRTLHAPQSHRTRLKADGLHAASQERLQVGRQVLKRVHLSDATEASVTHITPRVCLVQQCVQRVRVHDGRRAESYIPIPMSVHGYPLQHCGPGTDPDYPFSMVHSTDGQQSAPSSKRSQATASVLCGNTSRVVTSPHKQTSAHPNQALPPLLVPFSCLSSKCVWGPSMYGPIGVGPPLHLSPSSEKECSNQLT